MPSAQRKKVFGPFSEQKLKKNSHVVNAGVKGQLKTGSVIETGPSCCHLLCGRIGAVKRAPLYESLADGGEWGPADGGYQSARKTDSS